MTEEGQLDLKISDETNKQISGLLDRLGSTMRGGYPGAGQDIERIERPIVTELSELKSAEGLHEHRATANSAGGDSVGGAELRIWTVINGGLYQVDFKGTVVA